jgi:hypothetical protein
MGILLRVAVLTWLSNWEDNSIKERWEIMVFFDKKVYLCHFQGAAISKP